MASKITKWQVNVGKESATRQKTGGTWPPVALGKDPSMEDSHARSNQINGVVLTDRTDICPECETQYKSFRGMCQHFGKMHGGMVHLKHECEWCGEDLVDTPGNFHPEADNHFCCDSHRHEWTSERFSDRVSVECESCGDMIEKPPCEVDGTNNNFCSAGCLGDWMSENNTGEDHPRWTQETVECYWCGEGMELPKWKRERWERHFCSPECDSKWRSNEIVGPNHHNYKAESHKQGECENCGCVFEYQRGSTPGKYCSYKCRAVDKTGKDHPRWTGGRIDYGEGWTKEKRKKVRERAGYECSRCGKGQEETLEESNRKLHVHHIKPAKSVDNPEERNDIDNLVALCISCHMSIETRSEEVLS